MQGHTYASRDILVRMLDRVLAVEPDFEPKMVPEEDDLDVDSAVELFCRLRATMAAHEPVEEEERVETVHDWSTQHVSSVFSPLSREDEVLLKTNRDQYTRL